MDALLSADLSPNSGLASLAAAAFLAATLLPFPSEAALFAVLRLHPDLFWLAIVVATLANTAGGMTNYLVGRVIDKSVLHAKLPGQLERVRKWGAAATAFSWLPFIGEALCVASGWLKLNWISVLVWQLAGRGLRYWAVAHSGLI